MKRLASLVVVVLAFAVVPVALADDGGSTTAPSKPATHLRLDILRLRLDLVHLRYRIACHKPDSDRCTQFTAKIVDRLTTLDGNVQKKLDGCTSDDKKCAVLQKLDDRLQTIIGKLGSPPAPVGADDGLDQAAGDLAGLAKP